MYKLFNTKKVKVSYSCCPSIQSNISSHNMKVTQARAETREAGCNCQKGVQSCPLQGKCQTQGLVYRATVSSAEGVRHYTGHTANTFKLRYGNHKNSFTNPSKKKKHSTAWST